MRPGHTPRILDNSQTGPLIPHPSRCWSPEQGSGDRSQSHSEEVGVVVGNSNRLKPPPPCNTWGKNLSSTPSLQIGSAVRVIRSSEGEKENHPPHCFLDSAGFYADLLFLLEIYMVLGAISIEAKKSIEILLAVLRYFKRPDTSQKHIYI